MANPKTPSDDLDPMRDIKEPRVTCTGLSPVEARGILLQQRAIRRDELKQIVPLSETTIYEMERRGEFPQRFYLTPRCVAWDLGEVLNWVEQRRRDSDNTTGARRYGPDVKKRKARPVKDGCGEASR